VATKTYAERLAERLAKQAQADVDRAAITARRGEFLASVADTASDESDIEWAQNRAKSMTERAARKRTEAEPLTHVTPAATEALLKALQG
jgi:hypothetical protein